MMQYEYEATVQRNIKQHEASTPRRYFKGPGSVVGGWAPALEQIAVVSWLALALGRIELEADVLRIEVVVVPRGARIATALRRNHPKVRLAAPRRGHDGRVRAGAPVCKRPVVGSVEDRERSPGRGCLDEQQLRPLVRGAVVALVGCVVGPWVTVVRDPGPGSKQANKHKHQISGCIKREAISKGTRCAVQGAQAGRCVRGSTHGRTTAKPATLRYSGCYRAAHCRYCRYC